MHSKFRGFLDQAPIKLIAVILFAILVPSVLVTALGLVAVFQADAFVQDQFRRPIVEKLERLRGVLGETWSKRLNLYWDYLSDAPDRRVYLRDLCDQDPSVEDVLVSTTAGLERVPDPPPVPLWSPATGSELAVVERLELVDHNDELALAECQRLLATLLDDPVLLEVQLAASRTSYRLGQKELSLEYLRSAQERFGNTLDATGFVRELPLRWRIFEIERELGMERAALGSVNDLAAALKRYADQTDPELIAYYEGKLASLEEPYRPLVVLDSSRPGRGLDRLDATGLTLLSALLSGGRRSDFQGSVRRMDSVAVRLPSASPLYFVSLYYPEGMLWVHLLLDRRPFLDEVLLHLSIQGLPTDGCRFSDSSGNPVDDMPPILESSVSLQLPEPFGSLRLHYVAGEDELPESFRGFNILSLATFTWSVIVLVLTILVGVLFTLKSVLKEMRTARMKSDFVSFISHELKTPLTSIRMLTETVRSGRVENEQERETCIAMIDHESQRLSKLIDQILEYSRIERHQKEFQFTSCDMETVVREAVRLFHDHSRHDPREVEVISAQRISKIKMDQAAMVEVFLNLLSNAAKYSDKGNRITIHLTESIDDISVEVIDHGVGIRKRDQKKIFDKFYRADDFLTREVEGTGLGLTFARYVAKVHNGDIKVSSQPGAGSVFTVQLRKTDVLAE